MLVLEEGFGGSQKFSMIFNLENVNIFGMFNIRRWDRSVRTKISDLCESLIDNALPYRFQQPTQSALLC